MKRIFAIAALVGLLSTACSYEEGSRDVNIANEFSMAIPHFMDEFPELLEGAPLQYANRFRNLYLVGNKVEGMSLADLNAQETERLLNVLEDGLVYDQVEVEFGAAKGTRSTIFGKMNNEAIYYLLQTVESPDGVYFQCIWTRAENRWNTYEEQMNQILDSFKEI